MENGQMDSLARPPHLGVEAWARRLRYAFFTRLAQRHSALVATAHTASDQAETVLFNLLRGAGPKGLSGIPVKRLPFVRPLLDVSRQQVERYCQANGLAYVTDSTNSDLGYSRNRLRHQVFPLLQQVHPGARQALLHFSQDMGRLDAWLATLACQLLAQAASAAPDEASAGGAPWQAAASQQGFCAQTLLGAPAPVLSKALSLLAGPGANRRQQEQLQQLLNGQLGAVQQPAGVIARVRQGRLFLRSEPKRQRPPAYAVALQPGVHRLLGQYRLEVRIVEKKKNYDFCLETRKKGLTFVADYDKISECGVFRPRRPGDRFAPPGRGVTKTMKKWMNEAGTPVEVRDALPLLAHESRVLWVWGTGFCEGVAPDAQTKRLLFIHTALENGEQTL
jgi:tRNA(Ile)-lysidine synthase